MQKIRKKNIFELEKMKGNVYFFYDPMFLKKLEKLYDVKRDGYVLEKSIYESKNMANESRKAISNIVFPNKNTIKSSNSFFIFYFDLIDYLLNHNKNWDKEYKIYKLYVAFINNWKEENPTNFNKFIIFININIYKKNMGFHLNGKI